MNNSNRPARYRVALLPLALLAIIATTAIPIELRPAVWWDGGFDDTDFAENLLLYAPLGIALWRKGSLRVLVIAALLSASIEVLQMWQFERYSSPSDVFANTCGAWIGWLAWRRLARGTRLRADMPLLGKPWLAAAALIAAGLMLNWSLPLRSAAIADWRPDYALLLGNELTQDRAWEGTIRELALIPRALSADEIGALQSGGSTLDEKLRVAATYVLAQPLVLRGRGLVRLPEAVAQELVRQTSDANAFTVVARVTAANVLQEGPARIVSFSIDPHYRNFDLGQEGRRLLLRLRTPVSGPNGVWHSTESLPVLEAGKESLVIAGYERGVARIHVDGALVGRTSLAAAGCGFPALCDSYLSAGWMLLGASLAIIALALVPCRTRLPILLVAVLAGMLGPMLLQALPLADEILGLQAWPQWMALAGAAAIGVAATPAQDG